MQALWRVIRGVGRYRGKVILAFLCAIGVSLSYASGVATMLPVMKIFISTEGVHGWANQIAVQQRLHLRFLNLGSSARQNALALIVRRSTRATPAPLKALRPGDQIVRVQLPGVAGAVEAQSRSWLGMMARLAAAPRGTPVRLTITSNVGTHRRLILMTMPALRWYTRQFVELVRLLPLNAFGSLLWVVLLFIVLCVVGSAFRYYQQYLSMTLAARVIIDLRRRLYDRIVQLPTWYLSEKGSSDLTSRLTQDTSTLTDGVATLLGKTMLEPIKALTVALVALWIDWRLFLGTILVLPVIGLIIRKFARGMRRASRRGLEQWSDMLGIITETLSGLRIVKAYGGEGYERRRFARVNRRIFEQIARLNHYTALSRPTVETIAVILGSIPMLVAAQFVFRGAIGRDSFFLLLVCFAAIFEPLRKLSDVNSKLQQSNAAATRIFEIMDLQPEPNHSHALPRLARHSRSIEFDSVSFIYPGHRQQVLTDISFRVRCGQVAAVVGGNGSGKTTLLSLLPRLYTPSGGRVLIDSVDIATVSVASLRRQIGLVTQDTILFADTVYNNIAYGRRHAPRRQVLEASRRGYADEFIAALPAGYETLVGPSGMRLSGGQRQRIAIARAILRDPAILILDEAMSQIDSQSEFKIALALKEFMRDRTTLVVAHRLGTIIAADLIICLDAGRIVGAGSHADLLSSCDIYRRLYEKQFRDAGADSAGAAATTGCTQ